MPTTPPLPDRSAYPALPTVTISYNDFLRRNTATGKLKVQVGDNTEILGPGDTIYYDSNTPHGLLAVGGEDCEFYDYDEELDAYVCQVNLDEDEMYRFLTGSCNECPYYSSNDEYAVVRHQM